MNYKSSSQLFGGKPPTTISCHIPEAHEEVINSVSFSSQGNYFVTGSTDSTVKLWQATSGFHSKTLKGPTRSVLSAVFSPSDHLVAAGSNDGSITVWSTNSGAFLQTFHHRTKATTLGFLDDNQLVSGSHDRTIKVWNLQGGICTHDIGCNSYCNALVTTFAYVVSAHADRTIRLYELTHRKCVDKIDVHMDQVTGLTLSPDYCSILTTSRDNSLKLLDMRSFRVSRVFSHPSYSSSYWNRGCFSFDGNYVIAGSKDGSLFVWETATGKLESITPPFMKLPISATACSLLGNHLVTAQQKNLSLWG